MKDIETIESVVQYNKHNNGLIFVLQCPYCDYEFSSTIYALNHNGLTKHMLTCHKCSKMFVVLITSSSNTLGPDEDGNTPEIKVNVFALDIKKQYIFVHEPEPCPFDGETANIEKREDGLYRVACSTCRISTMWDKNRNTPIALWNKR